MNEKIFEVQIYFSGFSTYIIEAENEKEAIKKARLQPIKQNELFSNIQNWKDADNANEITEQTLAFNN